MPRIETPIAFTPEIAPLFSSCPREWLPLIIDDRSHVRSICFPQDGKDDEDDEEEHSDHHQEQDKPFADTLFHSFYSEAAVLRVPISSSSSEILRCNVVRLHALLRPCPMLGSDGSSSASLFGRSADGDPPIVQALLNDARSRAQFVREHLVGLMYALLPTVAVSADADPDAAQTPFLSGWSYDDDDSHKKEIVPVPRHITSLDAVELFDNPELLDRILFSYSLLLSAFGLRLHSFQDGSVDRAADWKVRYAEMEQNVEAQQQFVAAVSGMLRSLIDLRMRRIARRLVQFLFEELCAKRLLFLRQVWEMVWMPVVLVEGFEQQQDHEIKAGNPSPWKFDEEQKELWLRKLNADSSSDDE